MENVKFVTSQGEIRFGNQYMITKIEGLNEGGVNWQEYTYIDTDGAEYDNGLYDPRTVTISGYIRANGKNALHSNRAKLTQIINGKNKGILHYKTGSRQYFTEAIPELPEFGSPIQNFMPFVIYFKLYRFYWKEESGNMRDIWKREGKIKSVFSFPLVMTVRTNESTLYNGGDVAAPIIIRIYGGLTSAASTLSIDMGLTIVNKTTGKYIELEYDISKNEVITIDTDKATVISSINGNILHKMTEQSTFFKLQCGENVIEVLNHSGTQVVAIAEFYNLLVGV